MLTISITCSATTDSIRIHGRQSGYTFQRLQEATVFAFADLEHTATLFVAFRPRDSDVVLFGFHEDHQRTDPEGYQAHSNGRTDTPVYVVAVANLGNRLRLYLVMLLALHYGEHVRRNEHVQSVMLIEFQTSALILHADLVARRF
jgi:hypothetical protein